MFPKLSRADETLPEDVADFIADSLEETDELPRSQIAKVTKALGREETLALFHEVERIEAAGGLLVPDGSRRRTPGGVFFHLARKKLPRPLRFRIFAPPQPLAEQGESAGALETSAPEIPPQRPLKPPPPPAPRGGRPRTVEVEYVRRGPRPPATTAAPEVTTEAGSTPSPSQAQAPTPAPAPSPAGAPAPAVKRRTVISPRLRQEPAAAPAAPEPRPAQEVQPTARALTNEKTQLPAEGATDEPRAATRARAATKTSTEASSTAAGSAVKAATVKAPKSASARTTAKATATKKTGAVTAANAASAKTTTAKKSSAVVTTAKTASAKTTTAKAASAKTSAKTASAKTSTKAASAKVATAKTTRAKTTKASTPPPSSRAQRATARSQAKTARAAAPRRSRRSVDPIGDAIQTTVEQELSKLSPEERRKVIERLLGGGAGKRRR